MTNADWSIERYEARVAAKSYSQIGGIAFDELLTPVAKWRSMRILLASATREVRGIRQIDFSTETSRERRQQPERVITAALANYANSMELTPSSTSLAFLVLQVRPSTSKTEPGFKRYESDNGIYALERNGDKQLLSVYVDNETMAGSSKEGLAWTEDQLAKRFEYEDQAETRYILGVEMHRNRPKCEIFLSQCKHVQEIPKKLDMQDCQPIATPLDVLCGRVHYRPTSDSAADVLNRPLASYNKINY